MAAKDLKPRKIFEIPFTSAANDEDFYNEVFEPFVAKYKDWIHDIYFTYQTDVFDNDAMGGNAYSKNKHVIRKMLSIKDKYNISVCPTFNNVFVSPDAWRMKEFEYLLSRLIAMGIDMIQVPFTHWMMLGEYKARYPEIQFKDTVLQRRYFAQDLWQQGEAGYDITNVDRNVMRDEDTLKRIKKMKTKFKKKFGRELKVSLLANETCKGRCNIMDEHYMWNAKSDDNDEGYFNNIISVKSCSLWFQYESDRLRTSNFIPLRSEYDRYLEYIDVIKLHGRADLPLFEGSMRIIEDYASGKEFVGVDGSNFEYLVKQPKLLKQFLKVTKNCKFECWDCGLCDIIVEKYDERIKNGISDTEAEATTPTASGCEQVSQNEQNNQ